jgi:probable nitrogen fixation protein
MNDMTTLPQDAGDTQAQTPPFIKTLARLIRAHDLCGVWEKKSDDEILADFIVTREQRRTMPVIADVDRKLLWRIEQFYGAVGLTVGEATGIVATPMVKITHEGYGRVVLFAGRLVVLDRNVRDTHRFGFETQADMAQEGDRLAADATALIRKFPEVANL